MSSILDHPAIRHAVLPITVEQYHHLSEQSIISERTELLRGVIIEQMTKPPLHTYVVQFLVKWLESVIGAHYHVRKEEPLTLAESEPEPDVAVVRGRPEDYRTAHPCTAELVVEVAVTTLSVSKFAVPKPWVAGVERSEPPEIPPTGGSLRSTPATPRSNLEVRTLELDRDKADVYAAAGVPEYWIVVPDDRAVEVFRDPSSSGYGTRVRHIEPNTTLRSTSLLQASLRVASLFG